MEIEAGCRAWMHVEPLEGGQEFGDGSDELAVMASVCKVPLALEVEAQFADGRLDPRERVRLTERASGPTGFSLFEDDVEVSLRDLVVAMLTISDNAATDALFARVGVDAVNARLRALGLERTVITGDEQTLVDSVARDAGFDNWAALTAWSGTPEEERQIDERVGHATEMTPATGTRTTPREMVALLRMIWADEAAPATACARVRSVMRRQLTRHRIASTFRPPVRVAAKSGSLLGIVRNEVGVVELPDGRAFAAAVFTRSMPGSSEAAISTAIGRVVAQAIDSFAVGGSAVG